MIRIVDNQRSKKAQCPAFLHLPEGGERRKEVYGRHPHT
jgi:hypothetical protein